MTPSHGIRFWLFGALIGLMAALVAAVAAAMGLTLIAGIDQAIRRGPSIVSMVSAAKGLGLVFVYTTFFAVFIMPFSALAVPACYVLAKRLAAGTGWEAKLFFVTLALLFGTAGPYLVEHAAWAVYKMTTPGAFGVPSVWPAFTTFGLFAGPVAALLVWPFLQRLDARLAGNERPMPEPMSMETT